MKSVLQENENYTEKKLRFPALHSLIPNSIYVNINIITTT